MRPVRRSWRSCAGDAARIGTVPRLTGRNEPDAAAIRAARPELIIDYGTVDATYAALADRVQQATGVPYLLLDGSLLAIPRTYRLLREHPRRSRIARPRQPREELAADAERLLVQVGARTRAAPRSPARAIYYGRGADGLAAVRAGTISAEAIRVRRRDQRRRHRGRAAVPAGDDRAASRRGIPTS